MIGSYYTFGNVMPYVVSYMRVEANLTVTYADFATVQLVGGIMIGVSLFLTPICLTPFISNRLVCILGTIAYAAGPLLTRFFMDISLGLVILSYGVIQGLGNIVLMPGYIVCMSWFPEKRGTVMGIVVTGLGISSTLFTPIQLALCNPDNLEPEENPDGGDDKYFTDPDIIDNVPKMLYTLSLIYFIGMSTFVVLLSEPPKQRNGKNTEEPEAKKNLKDTLLEFKEEVLRVREFYLLFWTRFAFTMILNTVSTYYKTFALTFIDDDKFISTFIGTASGLCQVVSRISYGLAFDRLPYRFVVCFQSLVLIAFVNTLYFTSQMNSWAPFVLWMWIIYMTFPGIYAIIPAVSTEVFGSYGGVVMGIIGLGDIPLNIIISIVGDALLDGDEVYQIDYFYFFLFATIGPVIGFFVTLFFRQTHQDIERTRKTKAALRTMKAKVC